MLCRGLFSSVFAIGSCTMTHSLTFNISNFCFNTHMNRCNEKCSYKLSCHLKLTYIHTYINDLLYRIESQTTPGLYWKFLLCTYVQMYAVSRTNQACTHVFWLRLERFIFSRSISFHWSLGEQSNFFFYWMSFNVVRISCLRNPGDFTHTNTLPAHFEYGQQTTPYAKSNVLYCTHACIPSVQRGLLACRLFWHVKRGFNLNAASLKSILFKLFSYLALS